MFDDLVDDTTGARGAAAVRAWARVESAACARRLAAMVAMLDAAHAADGSADREQWCLDNWGAVCAHIGAAQAITSGAASGLMMVGTVLRDRLPAVGAVFAAGLIGYPLARIIVYRTMLVTDPVTLRALDATLAHALTTWAPMSVNKTEETIDAFIDQFDPLAVRRTHTSARSRCLDVAVEDGSGLASLFGSLFAPDAKALDIRLDALARTACPADPRTIDQRRADAMGALAHGAERLACLCGTQDCPAADNAPSTGVVIHIIAHHDTLARPRDSDDPSGPDEAMNDTVHDECAGLDGVPPALFAKPLRELTLTDAMAPRRPGRLSTIRPGTMMGGQFLPGAVTRRAALGASLIAIVHPGQAPPEARYTPSRELLDFVRCRDQTCRFPGCRESAMNCDVDHTIPWPYGPTCASNLKCLCRRINDYVKHTLKQESS